MIEKNTQPKSPLSRVSINGDKVRSIRESKGLTQLYVATVLGVTTDTISRWENRRYPTIKLENAEKLARTLDVDAADILDRTEAGQGEDYTGPAKIIPFRLIRRFKILLLAAIPAIFLVFWFTVILPEKSIGISATRFLPKHTPVNQPFPVIIKVESDNGGPFSFILQETLPDSCTPIKSVPPFIHKKAEQQTVKWICNSKKSPYFIAYLAIASPASSSPEKLDFKGLMKVDKPQDNSQKIRGSSFVTIANYHWADSDADSLIDDVEILAIYNSFDALNNLGVDLTLIKTIWSGKGYTWNPENQSYTVTR